MSRRSNRRLKCLTWPHRKPPHVNATATPVVGFNYFCFDWTKQNTIKLIDNHSVTPTVSLPSRSTVVLLSLFHQCYFGFCSSEHTSIVSLPVTFSALLSHRKLATLQKSLYLGVVLLPFSPFFSSHLKTMGHFQFLFSRTLAILPLSRTGPITWLLDERFLIFIRFGITPLYCTLSYV